MGQAVFDEGEVAVAGHLDVADHPSSLDWSCRVSEHVPEVEGRPRMVPGRTHQAEAVNAVVIAGDGNWLLDMSV